MKFNQVPQFTVPNKPELALKLLICNIKNDRQLMKYFDIYRIEKGEFPEKQFFWGIMYAVRFDLTQAMIAEVIERRIAEQQ